MPTVFDAITEAIREQICNGRTQKEMADELGITQTMVSAIIRGTRLKTAEAVLAANPLWLQGYLWRGHW